MNQWTNKSMNECMNQWTVEQMNQGANESMNFANLILQNSSDSFNLFGGFEVQIELLLQSRAHFVSFICQKCSDPFSFFLRLWSAKQFLWNTVSCAFCQLHLPKLLRYAPIPSVFLRFRHANRALVTVLSTFCRPYLPKVFRAWQIFNIWSANRAFPTVWCAFFRPPLLKVFWSLQFFFTFEVQIRLLPRSCTLFANLIFQKCSGIVSFSTFWNANRAATVLCTVLCTFCWQFSQLEARNRGNTLLWRPQEPEKTHGFVWRVSSPVNSHASELLRFPTNLTTYLIMGGWHDDVADMMVGMLTR